MQDVLQKGPLHLSHGGTLPARDVTPHGTRRTYRQGCRCTPCKAANAAYWSAWHRTRLAGQTPLGSRISATETARKIAALLVERFTKAEIARRLGRTRPKFRLPDRVTLRTALKIRRLYRLVMLESDEDSPAQSA